MFFQSILKLAPPSNKQTFVKIDFEISVQPTYLKKLGTRNVAGVDVDVTEKYRFIPCTIKC